MILPLLEKLLIIKQKGNMQRGAILLSSVELINEILNRNNLKTEFIIKNFFRKNKFAGSKDKKQIKDLIFGFFKSYFTLKKAFKDKYLKFSYRNGLLFYYFNINAQLKLDNIYEGKYSIKPAPEDKKIFMEAISLKSEVVPTLPSWLEVKLNDDLKKEKAKIYESILAKPRLDIRVNNHLIKREKVLNILEKNNILSKKTSFSPLGITVLKRTRKNILEKLKNNFFEIQDEGSQLVTILSSVEKDMKVLDYCAGKGTKTLALYDQMLGKGELYVYDISNERLNILRKRIDTLNIKKKIMFFHDTKKLINYFDLILLDVPCSGSGVWRRRPEDLIKLDKYKLKNNIVIQKKLLDRASTYCKKNGIISYITCSIFKDENENQIESFVSKNKGFKILDINLNLKKKLQNMDLQSKKKWLTLTPSYCNSDGFFICLLKKYV